MRYARIVDGVVHEIIIVPEDADLAGRFHPDIVATLVVCGKSVVQNYRYDGTVFLPPLPPPPSETPGDRIGREAETDPFKRALIARIAAAEGKSVAQVIAELRALA